MNDMRWTAQQLAARGRFGDTMLIHVNPAEVAGIASLIPGGLTINPVTGLPEAFFFLPFLASLFGAAAPAATAAAAAAPALLGAAGTAAAGVGSGVMSALGAAGTGIANALAAPIATAAHGIGALGTAASGAGAGTMSALGSLGTGLGNAVAAPITTAAHGIGALGTAASAAPTAAGALIDPIVTGATGANALAGAAGGDTLASLTVEPLASTAVPAVPAIPAAGAGPSSGSYLGAIGHGAGPSASPYTVAAKAVPTPPVLKPPAVPAAGPSAPSYSIATHGLPYQTDVVPVAKAGAEADTGGGGILGMIKNNPMMAMAGLSALGSLFKGGGTKKKKSDKKLPRYESGGDPQFPSTVEGYGTSSYSPAGEWNYFPHQIYANNGGLVRGYANGGIVGLAQGGGIDLQAQLPQDMGFPLNGVPGGGTDEAPMLEDIPSSPYPSSQIGAMPESQVDDTVEAPTADDHELIMQTVEALQGKIADPRPVFLAFIQTFGEQALQDLAMRVKSMGAQDKGDGQSDSIPAVIDGQQPAALSQGEFVVPADAVSHLGNGSTDAGADRLQSLVDGVRQARTGRPQQPPALNAGGLVRDYARQGIVGLAGGGRVQFGPTDPLDDLDQYRPGIIWPEVIDRLIPSVLGKVTTDDWFATGPEIRRGQAKRERSENAQRDRAARRKH